MEKKLKIDKHVAKSYNVVQMDNMKKIGNYENGKEHYLGH